VNTPTRPYSSWITRQQEVGRRGQVRDSSAAVSLDQTHCTAGLTRGFEKIRHNSVPMVSAALIHGQRGSVCSR